MRQVRPSSLLITLGILATLSSAAAGETLMLRVTSTPYEIARLDSGFDRVSMEGFSRSLVPGKPRLPARVVHVPLPPGVRVSSVELAASHTVLLPGRYRVEAAGPMTPAGADPRDTEECLETWSANHENTYGSNKPCPPSPIELLGQSARGSEVFARVRFSPFRYRPLSETLELVEWADIVVHYEPLDTPQPLFTKRSTGARDGSFPYVIVTTDSLSAAVDTLVTWKTYVGLPTQVVTDSWIASNYAGEDIQEKVRNFLIDKYTDWGIQWVLIVADSTAVPMRACHPVANSPYGILPTDYYYADLTGDWDSDGDGYYGEYGNDDYDYVAEVFVGRIPFGEFDAVKSVCEKLVAVEADTTDWKHDALLMGAILNFENEAHMGRPRTDGAELMEQLRTDVFLNGTRHTLYEKEGIEPCPYECTWPIELYRVRQMWSAGDYGLVTWHSHGLFDEAKRKYWEWDDGDSIPEYAELERFPFLWSQEADSLDDEHPGVVFACACDNGDQDEPVNLAFALLKNGASSIVAATRPGYYTNGWLDKSDGGIASLDYYFFDALVGGQKVGEALFTTKEVYADSFFWWDVASHQNMLTFCLYGDPAFVQPGIGALTPEIVVQSPAAGENGIPVWSGIEMTFSRPMKAQTINGNSWIVTGQRSGPHCGVVDYDPATLTAHFAPEQEFAPGEQVTVVLTDTVISTMSLRLEHPYVCGFFTRSFDGTGDFATADTLEIAGYPSAVAAADLNADGLPDLAVTPSQGHQVSVFLNLGNGHYAGAVDFPGGVTPAAIAPGDLDGDGAVDLAVAGDGTLTLLFNDGNGSFPSQSTYTVGDSASAVVVGEIDGDGDLDLVVADRSLDSVWVFFNEGDTLSAPTVLWAGARPTALAFGDIDGDGWMDLLCALRESDSLAVFINEGGSYGARTTVLLGGPSSAVTCGDLNGDTWIDVAVTDPAADCVRVFLNQGGVLLPDSTYSTGGAPLDVAISDFDGDGDLDLATADYGGAGVTVFLNNGDGFVPTERPVAAGVAGLAVCDSDNDSDVDLVAALAAPNSNVMVLLNSSDPTAADEGSGISISRLALHQNTPNPFNPVTEIRFDLPRAMPVSLAVYDVRGRLARRLMNANLPAGAHRVVWDGHNEHGRQVASGIYLYRLETGRETLVRKMVVVR
ncbi:MAG: VCBS repeat-containing protein [Candidatus Eisenbacteria sp.]|nr:VCBS repeat-containing protein [Candidatus Eisenbacteria bacterium]